MIDGTQNCLILQLHAEMSAPEWGLHRWAAAARKNSEQMRGLILEVVAKSPATSCGSLISVHKGMDRCHSNRSTILSNIRNESRRHHMWAMRQAAQACPIGPFDPPFSIALCILKTRPSFATALNESHSIPSCFEELFRSPAGQPPGKRWRS
jgi:hypothetical protein